ncbi:hypothetical protein CB1_000513027 [Camelus ferus]|nr:hypothetical protein CB1_000513027 [Camelus ferus]
MNLSTLNMNPVCKVLHILTNIKKEKVCAASFEEDVFEASSETCLGRQASAAFAVSLGFRAFILIWGQDADQLWMMQEQITGAAMAVPTDTNKAFKTEWEAWELDHQWALDNVEEELMAKDLHFEGTFRKELQTSIF